MSQIHATRYLFKVTNMCVKYVGVRSPDKVMEHHNFAWNDSKIILYPFNGMFEMHLQF